MQLYSNWDGLISSRSATGYSVKKTADGEPDGLYKFIYKQRNSLEIIENLREKL